MISGGTGGGNTNASGKPFEECFRPIGTHDIGGTQFTYIQQDQFVEYMKNLKDPNWAHKKKPDGAFISDDKKTLFIIECKHQIVSGSVDEKLRSGPCLLEEYKYLYPTIQNVFLMFIVNHWWYGRQKKYEIPIAFNEKHGIPVFFAKQIGSKWKIHIQKALKKWTIYPAFYGVDEDAIFEWMRQRVLQSS
jgi:hypothetical protein